MVLDIEQLPMGVDTKKMIKFFSDAELTEPKTFISSMFGKAPGVTDYSDTETVSIEVERDGERIASDVVRGGTGNLNTIGRSTEKIYIPPFYDECSITNAFKLNKRMPGESPAQAAQVNRTARLLYNITETLMRMRKKIVRAIELMGVQALWDGQITLKNGESILFYRKASHNIDPVYPWTDQTNGDPIADMAAACYVVRIDGKVKSNVALMSESAFSMFVNHQKVLAYLDNRRIEPGFIRPAIDETEGITYQGWINVGDYRLDIYTYPEYYQDDTGTYYAYIPDDTVLIMSTNTRLDKSFGALSLLDRAKQSMSAIGIRVPMVVQGDFIPYFKEEGMNAVRVGIQSAPLLIPTQIDGFARINVG